MFLEMVGGIQATDTSTNHQAVKVLLFIHPSELKFTCDSLFDQLTFVFAAYLLPDKTGNSTMIRCTPTTSSGHQPYIRPYLNTYYGNFEYHN